MEKKTEFLREFIKAWDIFYDLTLLLITVQMFPLPLCCVSCSSSGFLFPNFLQQTYKALTELADLGTD